MNSLFFSISSFLFLILLLFNYFSRAKQNSLEIKIYSFITVICFFTILIELMFFLASYSYDKIPLLCTIALKLYFGGIIGWLGIFTNYVLIISHENYQKGDNKFQLFMGKLKRVSLLAFGIIYILLIISPMDYDGISITSGSSIYLVYAYSSMCIILWLYCFITNFKNIKNKKYLPVFAFIVIGSVAVIIQKYNPSLILMGLVQALVTFLMYFTIENPDLKMLNEMNLAKEQVNKANRAKSDFLSSMSHEIRTPLNTIIGFTELLQDSKNLSNEERDNLKDIKSASDTLLDIINNILDMNKIEGDNTSFDHVNYGSNEVFTGVADLIKHRFKEKGLEFKINISPDIPKELYGDKIGIKKIITNLLSNAFKYTDQGSVEYDVRSVINGDICRLIITISDTGRGIKKENIKKLFTKFERFDEKNTVIEGIGLGLAITKSMLSTMGGQITVSSEFGVGSRFVVTLDQKIINATPIGVITSYTSNSKVKAFEENNEAIDIKIDMSSKRILIVDDNNLNLKVAANLLKKNYHMCDENIVCISSGQECIDRIKANEGYDLILMDDMMPVMDGQQTFKILKSLNGFNIPTVMLTANAVEGAKEMYLKQGFIYYLSKPIKIADMDKAFEYVFRNIDNEMNKKTNFEVVNTSLEKPVFPPLPKEIYQVGGTINPSSVSNIQF